MKIIKDKKLFGKITIFDIIIALVGVIIIVFAYNYLYSSSSVKVGNTYENINFKIKHFELALYNIFNAY